MQIRYLTVISFVFLTSSCCNKFTPNVEKDSSKYVEVQKILKAISGAVHEARLKVPEGYAGNAKSDPNNLLHYLDEVEVELSNSFSTKVGSDVKFWVVKGGVSRGAEKTTTFKYTFKPSNQNPSLNNTEVQKSGKQLSLALEQLGTCLKQYKNENYNLSKVSLEVGFEVKKSAEAGVEFDILVFSINPSGSIEWAKGNTITLSFDLEKAKP